MHRRDKGEQNIRDCMWVRLRVVYVKKPQMDVNMEHLERVDIHVDKSITLIIASVVALICVCNQFNKTDLMLDTWFI